MLFTQEEISDMLLLSSNPERLIYSDAGRIYIGAFKNKNLTLLACLLTGLNIYDYFSREEVIALRRKNDESYIGKILSFIPDYAFFDRLNENRGRPFTIQEAGNLMYGDMGFGNPVYKLKEALTRSMNYSFYNLLLKINTKKSKQVLKELFS